MTNKLRSKPSSEHAVWVLDSRGLSSSLFYSSTDRSPLPLAGDGPVTGGPNGNGVKFWSLLAWPLYRVTASCCCNLSSLALSVSLKFGWGWRLYWFVGRGKYYSFVEKSQWSSSSERPCLFIDLCKLRASIIVGCKSAKCWGGGERREADCKLAAGLDTRTEKLCETDKWAMY